MIHTVEAHGRRFQAQRANGLRPKGPPSFSPGHRPGFGRAERSMRPEGPR